MKTLIGNKVAEKDIREWLSQNGFFGRSARFKELELHAIQRPGWLQVFRFTVEAKTQTGGWTTFFGAVRDDERKNETTIKTFAKYSDQQRLLADWSANLIRRHSNRSDEVLSMPWLFVSVGGFVAGLILMLYLASLVDLSGFGATPSKLLEDHEIQKTGGSISPDVIRIGNPNAA